MGFGGQSRGLIAASKTMGWDPTVIPGVGSIADFDKMPTHPDNRTVGSMTPAADTLQGEPGPDIQYDPMSGVGTVFFGAPNDTPPYTVGLSGDKVYGSAPDFTRETKNRATRNANPFAGMGGE